MNHFKFVTKYIVNIIKSKRDGRSIKPFGLAAYRKNDPNRKAMLLYCSFLELTIDLYQWQEVTTQIIQVHMHDGAENEIMKENKEDLSICTWLQFVPMCSHEARTYFM